MGSEFRFHEFGDASIFRMSEDLLGAWNELALFCECWGFDQSYVARLECDRYKRPNELAREFLFDLKHTDKSYGNTGKKITVMTLLSLCQDQKRLLSFVTRLQEEAARLRGCNPSTLATVPHTIAVQQPGSSVSQATPALVVSSSGPPSVLNKRLSAFSAITIQKLANELDSHWEYFLPYCLRWNITRADANKIRNEYNDKTLQARAFLDKLQTKDALVLEPDDSNREKMVFIRDLKMICDEVPQLNLFALALLQTLTE